MRKWFERLKRSMRPIAVMLVMALFASMITACTDVSGGERSGADAEAERVQALQMEAAAKQMMAEAEKAKAEAEAAKAEAVAKAAEAEKVASELAVKETASAEADAAQKAAEEEAAKLKAEADALAAAAKKADDDQRAKLLEQAKKAQAELVKKQAEAAAKAKEAAKLKAELDAKANEASKLAAQALAAEEARKAEEANRNAEAAKAAEATAALAAAKKELEDKSKWPEVIRFGAVPGENQQALDAKFKKFAADLGAHLGRKVTFTTNSDYTATIEALRAKKLEFAEFGPFSYIIANERSNAYAFAAGAKGRDKLYYNSLIIVPANSPAKTIEDLKGKKFLFVDPASSSGHLYPKSMIMKAMGLKTPTEVEQFFGNVSFSGTHDASALAVARGDADGAAVSDSILATLQDKGAVKSGDVRVILKSENIPTSPFAYRGDLPTDLVEKVKKFMYTYNDPELFAKLKINGFYPVEDALYEPTRNVAKNLGMSPEQLLK